MAHKDRKIQKLRGSRTCGWGSAQKHRGAGSRGGRGMAGSKKHKWMKISKEYGKYFGVGRIGFRRKMILDPRPVTINVGVIDENIKQWLNDDLLGVSQDGDTYNVNLPQMGYDKLLGSGKVSHKLNITANSCSKSAAEKVASCGGAVNTGEQQVEDIEN